MTRLPPSSPLLPSPCVHSTRPRVCVQNVPVCTGNMPVHKYHLGQNDYSFDALQTYWFWN